MFVNISGEAVYPRELLLRLILMSVFDDGLPSREIDRRTRNDVSLYVFWQECKNILSKQLHDSRLITLILIG